MPTDPRKTKYRQKLRAMGPRDIAVTLNAGAIAELDRRCTDADLSRGKLIERWLGSEGIEKTC